VDHGTQPTNGGSGEAEAASVVVGFITRVVNGPDLDAVADFVAPDYVDHGFGPLAREEPDLIRTVLARMRRHFPDFHTEILRVDAHGDLVTVHQRAVGTRVGDGCVLSWLGEDTFRVAGGRIVERWAAWRVERGGC
jgi:predicted SnoaL-like aldol condensation-catalyzing enzyme